MALQIINYPTLNVDDIHIPTLTVAQTLDFALSTYVKSSMRNSELTGVSQ